MWSFIVSLFFIFSFLPLVLPESSKFRFYACFISYTLLQMFSATLYMFVYIFTRDPQNYCVKTFAINIISTVLGIKIDVKGEENVDTSMKAMIVGNHQSALDVVVGYVIFDRCRNCTCVARKEVSYLGPFGVSTRLGGFIFIDRENKDLAKKKLSEDTDQYFTAYKNGKILVFPEGTRNNIGGEFLEFKKGAFFLAIEKQVPILPVVISPFDFIKPFEYFKKGRIILSFLKPISTEGMVAKEVDVLIEKTRKVMIEEYNILRNEDHWRLQTMELQSCFLLIVLLRFLYVICPKFAYRLKWLFFVLVVVFCASVLSPYYVLKKKEPKNLNFFKYSARFICWVFGLEMDIHGESEEIKKGNGVVVSNHQSILDIVCIAKFGEYYGHIVAVAKSSLKYFFPLGTILGHCGYIFIDRTKSKEAARILSQKSTAHFKKYKNGKIFIFPEGTRNSKKNEFLVFKKGAFKTAIDNQVPIYPCVISPYYFLEEDQYFGKGRIIIKLLSPIPTAGLSENDLESLIDKTRSLMWVEYFSLACDLGVENCLKR